MAEAILKKTSEAMPEGKIDVNETFSLTKLVSLEITKTRKKHNSKNAIYNVSVKSEHPRFGDISFSFPYVPAIKQVANNEFLNVKKERICAGTPPKGDIKDIVIAVVTEESYAYQMSNKRTTWCHAERDPNQGEYLLWHLLYYGKYSPRSPWRLPERCERERLFEKNKCNLCSGQKCDHIKKTCKVCGKPTTKACHLCNEPICTIHSHCPNGHNILTEHGMFHGTCRTCGVKVPIERRHCECGSTQFSKF